MKGTVAFLARWMVCGGVIDRDKEDGDDKVSITDSELVSLL